MSSQQAEAKSREMDRAARRAAQSDFSRPLVLEAGAGTGKTAALVARVVAWTLGPGWELAADELPASAESERVAARALRRVVAITFTEAAAAEMGQRVSEALAEIEQGRVPVGVFEEALHCAPERRAQRAVALRAVLDQMRVQTIHAFCRRLLAEHPIEAGLHPRFVVDADESRQKAVVREVLEAALPELLGPWPAAREAPAETSASRAFLRLARAGVGPRQIEEALLLLLQQGADVAALRENPLAPERVSCLLDELARELREFHELEAGRIEGLRGAPKASDTASLLRQLGLRVESASPRDAALITQLRNWLEEASLDVGYVRGWARGKFGKKGGDALGDDAEQLASRAARLHPLLQHLERLDPHLLADARQVLAPLYQETWRRLRALGVATFPSLLRDARDLLAREPELCARLRRQISQLLVDEFQDTDPVQCEVIRLLALEGSERPGLFLVGDPKQSIYGWRSADLAAYEGFVQHVCEAGGERRALVVNHRSAPAVLDEVARTIAPVMQAVPGLQPAFEPLLPCEARRDDAGFTQAGCAPVEHWVSWRWDEPEAGPAALESAGPGETKAAQGNAVEARALAAELVRLQAAGAAWADFGLLFRAGTDLETYLAELRRAGVPFSVEGDRSYFQRREIIEAAALVRCVLDPHDQLALLTLLRSAVVGVPDAALIPLWARDLPARLADLHGVSGDALAALRGLVDAAASEVPSDIPAIERVAGWVDNLLAAARSLALLRESFECDPADHFVEKLRRLFFFEVTEAARYLGAYRLANLERFFRDLQAALRDGEGDPRAILRSLREDVALRREAEEGRPVEAVLDAVQITTIHKAKGLAFEHVYLLQLHKGRGTHSEARVERLDGALEYQLLGARTPGYHRVEARREEVERHERVRTLYVAATRARQRLVFAGIRDECAQRSSPDSLIALLEQREGGVPDLIEPARALSQGQGASFDAAGARWVFPALRSAAEERLPERRRAVATLAEVRAAAEVLSQRRARAGAELARSFGAPISGLAHEAALDSWREGPDAREGETDAVAAHPGPSRDAAAAVGTAVHGALERLDLAGDLAAGLAAQRGRLEDELLRGLRSHERPAALARAAELLARFAAGPLLARLERIAPHVVARELPVLLPPPDREGAPVGYLSGAIDLLYRDPDDGQLVVADYKTDRVQGERELRERTANHTLQGAGYVRAVQEALGLRAPPRFELWFIDTGRIEQTTAEQLTLLE